MGNSGQTQTPSQTMQCVSSMVPHGENKQGVSDSTFYKITLVFVTVNSEPDKV